MRLTKQLKNDLLVCVMKDQFLAEAENINKRIKDTATAAVVNKFDTLDAAMHELATEYELDPAFFCNKNHKVEITAEDEFFKGRNTHYLSHMRIRAGLGDREMTISRVCSGVEPNIYVPPTSAWGDRCYDAKLLGVQELLGEYAELSERAYEVHEDLIAVLNSFSTTKKLQEVTKVFDPFIPSANSGCTSIIAAEPLCRINELKSPKND